MNKGLVVEKVGGLTFRLKKTKLEVLKDEEKIEELPVSRKTFEALASVAAHVKNCLPEKEHTIFMFFIEDAMDDLLDGNEEKPTKEQRKKIIERACELIVSSEYYWRAMYGDVEKAIGEVLYPE